MDDPEASQIVIRNALAPTVIGRDFTAHFLRNCDGFRDRVIAEKENPVALTVGPRGLSNTVRPETLRDVGLLDVTGVLVPADFRIHDEGQAGVSVLVDSFEGVLEGP